MALSIAVFGTTSNATLVVEAVDPSWPRPTGANEFELLESLRDSPAPLHAERVELASSIPPLLESMRALEPEFLESATGGGVGGWTARCIVAPPGKGRHDFEVWSPNTTGHDRHHAFVCRLLKLAKTASHRPPTHAALAKWDKLL